MKNSSSTAFCQGLYAIQMLQSSSIPKSPGLNKTEKPDTELAYIDFDLD